MKLRELWHGQASKQGSAVRPHTLGAKESESVTPSPVKPTLIPDLALSRGEREDLTLGEEGGADSKRWGPSKP